MAKDTIDEACKILNHEVKCTTELHYLIGGENYSFEEWKNIQKTHNLDEDICQHLLKKYGTNAKEILEVSNQTERIHKDYPFIKSEVFYTIHKEMAGSLRDFFARRTRMELMDWEATLSSVDTVGDIMAIELNWSEIQKQTNIEDYKKLLKSFIKTANIN
jgi:glycerol-3-phosphate dehydrogenase